MKLQFSRQFKKRKKKLPVRVGKRLEERLLLFSEDPFNPVLRNHVLAGEYAGYRSIDITGDWRAVYETQLGDVAYFVDVGTHAYLYG